MDHDPHRRARRRHRLSRHAYDSVPRGVVDENHGGVLADLADPYPDGVGPRLSARDRCDHFAAAELFDRDEAGKPRHRWRAGGLVAQFLPEAPERMRQPDLHGGDGDTAGGAHKEDDAWAEARSLVDTEGANWRRVGWVAVLALATLALGAGLLAVSDLLRAGGIAVDALGAVAALAALGLLAVVARDAAAK